MLFVEILGLGAAAAMGGAINAVAGGGTMLTFPALLAFGMPAVAANATSTLALVVGNIGSVYGYRRQMAPVRVWLKRFLPVSIAGALLGSWLLTVTSEQAFKQLVPFLILFATVLFCAQGAFRKLAANQTAAAQPPAENSRRVAGAILFQFFVALYGGYFGAGIGILMLASLGFIGLADIHEMNALKTILGGLINLVAAVWFVFAGLIVWPQAVVMMVCALAGYYLGAHYAQKIPQVRVRQIIMGIGIILTVVAFYEQFLK